MQNQHETLGEIIKNARMKADITVEDLAAKVQHPDKVFHFGILNLLFWEENPIG